MQLTENSILVESVSDLPNPKAKRMWVDFETTSFDPTKKALYPYIGHRIAGICFLKDEDATAYYIPIRHTDKKWNLPLDNVLRWLKDALSNPVWVNHNIKFDAHFAYNDGIDFKGTFIDTLTGAKCHHSDLLSYDLKSLCRDWLQLPMAEELEVHAYLRGMKSKNFGDVPADILGKYGCMDVLGNRELDAYLEKNRPSQVQRIWGIEVKFTRVLYEIEKQGLRIEPNQVKAQLLKTIRSIIDLESEIHSITKQEFVDSYQHLTGILCSQFGLSPLTYTEKGNPSFDKVTLNQYLAHPDVISNPDLLRLVQLIIKVRKEIDFKSSYLEPYLKFVDGNNRIHPSYNQVIRTGRTSCREPALQGASKRAKELILPSEGKVLVLNDASQIEFRLMVHYMQDANTIKKYNDDPDTDFHQWVADLCSDIGLKRKPAKSLNFAMGYGAGKRKVVSMLSGNPDIMDEIGKQMAEMEIENKDRTYKKLCEERASELYTTYHERIPVKAIAEFARRKCAMRGFTFNIFGRRRHLPNKAARKAFNSVIQGGAMDYIKTRMIALYESNLPYTMLGEIHDAILSEADPEDAEKNKKELIELLCDCPVPLRVPLRWSYGTGENWREID